MRIIQLLVLVMVAAVGAWARAYHRQITRELRADQMGEYSMDASGSYVPFEADFSHFTGGSKTSKPKYTPPPPVEPSEVQANPFLK